MIGRQKELDHLNSLFESNSFEYLVMYGRRRIGKTTLLQEFARKNNCIFFPAREKNDALNLEDFSKVLQLHFTGTFIASFQSWEKAFDYVSENTKTRTALIIDEFPYIAEENPTVKSLLQHAIDHSWKKNKNLFLILCGSSVSIMENDILGKKSPLHARQTSTLEIKPFDYLESSLFFPNYSNVDKLLAYGILGGVPRYLESFHPDKGIKENIASRIIQNGSILHEEPDNLLKAELRETNVYNSILSAIANGKNKIVDIADYIHEDRTKVSKYMQTLQVLRLVEKKIPCDETETSRKSIYVIKDNFFKFWFRYQFSNNSYYSILGPEESADMIMSDISNHMGLIFEDICTDFLIRLAKNRKLPFIPFKIGKWWGNNPVLRAQDDIDILAIDQSGNQALFVECKFQSKPMTYDEMEDLFNAAKAFPKINNKHFMFISKSGYSDSVIKKAKEQDIVLYTIDDLFDECVF